MSQTPTFNNSSTLYRYVVVGVLSVVVFIGAMLFWRSRVLERRLASYGPVLHTANRAPERPRLYDMYLDSPGQLWHEIRPLCVHQMTPPAPPPAKHASLDMDPLISAQVTLAFFIAMPFLDTTSELAEFSGDSDPERSHSPPYVEFGVADVQVLGGIPGRVQ
ncbi:hypothetical protein B0H12DRAFT_1107933 [Mycena haematopus]|nr:hypothetical protein B0H12DRAFT_1107933 [Mycena haematopus]